MSEQVFIYFDIEGKRVSEPYHKPKGGCKNTIKFCATSIVPDGFIFKPDKKDFKFSFCQDISELKCVPETVKVETTVVSPCDETLKCPVSLQAVRAVGCVRFYVNLEKLVPKKPGLSLATSGHCSLSFYETVCVNQIIGYRCLQEPIKEDCFDVYLAAIGAPKIITDPCGRQIVSIEGEIGIILKDSKK